MPEPRAARQCASIVPRRANRLLARHLDPHHFDRITQSVLEPVHMHHRALVQRRFEHLTNLGPGDRNPLVADLNGGSVPSDPAPGQEQEPQPRHLTPAAVQPLRLLVALVGVDLHRHTSHIWDPNS
jgi:hypothetical protein